ncbi:epididymal secretory protein E1 [Pundamilia nyererei]|uniref:NPC intracellular cholesterol transporter 2 n=1 Tax=Pundamilia nyererei TaxID=303518 RepID=A0A3B4HAU4_9CICH|nr:PREDICTED: epididymal secretory protein E1 [Pundamilia nyererei]
MDARTSFIVLCLIGFSCAETVKFLDCGSVSGKVATVEITPCPSQPCKLKRGDSYTVNVTFTSTVPSQESTAVVHGVIAGVPIPFAIPNVDGCKSGIQCPIQNGQTYHYVATLPVKDEYPALKLVVEWELRDDNTKDLFCIKFPVELV